MLLGAWAQAAVASDFLITTWRTEDGLPHSGVNSIVQTRDGYLWIGTYVGDGQRVGAAQRAHALAEWVSG